MEPSPALKHRLLPALRDLRPGNAALLYQRAHSPEWFGVARQPEFEKIYEYLEQPLAKMPRDKVSDLIMRPMMKEIDLAARRSHCDWEMMDRIRDEGYEMLLPDVQAFRTYSVLLSARTRTHLLDRDFGKALYSMQTHFALSKHLSEARILINVLVANAILSREIDDLEEMSQLEGAPNLFWALAYLPKPFIQMHHALEGNVPCLKGPFPGFGSAE